MEADRFSASINFLLIPLFIPRLNSSTNGLPSYLLSLAAHLNSYMNSSIILSPCSNFLNSAAFTNSSSLPPNSFFKLVKNSSADSYSMSQTSFSLYLHNQWTNFHILSCAGKPQMRAIHTYVGCTKAITNDWDIRTSVAIKALSANISWTAERIRTIGLALESAHQFIPNDIWCISKRQVLVEIQAYQCSNIISYLLKLAWQLPSGTSFDHVMATACVWIITLLYIYLCIWELDLKLNNINYSCWYFSLSVSHHILILNPWNTIQPQYHNQWVSYLWYSTFTDSNSSITFFFHTSVDSPCTYERTHWTCFSTIAPLNFIFKNNLHAMMNSLTFSVFLLKMASLATFMYCQDCWRWT